MSCNYSECSLKITTFYGSMLSFLILINKMAIKVMKTLIIIINTILMDKNIIYTKGTQKHSQSNLLNQNQNKQNKNLLNPFLAESAQHLFIYKGKSICL